MRKGQRRVRVNKWCESSFIYMSLPADEDTENVRCVWICCISFAIEIHICTIYKQKTGTSDTPKLCVINLAQAHPNSQRLREQSSSRQRATIGDSTYTDCPKIVFSEPSMQ